MLGLQFKVRSGEWYGRDTPEIALKLTDERRKTKSPSCSPVSLFILQIRNESSLAESYIQAPKKKNV